MTHPPSPEPPAAHHGADGPDREPAQPDDHGPPDTDLPRLLTLREVAPGTTHGHLPVLTRDGDSVVVLDAVPDDPGRVQVWSPDRGERTLPWSTLVVLLRPDTAAVHLLGRAVAHLVARIRSMHARPATVRHAHDQALNGIRDHVIARYRRGLLTRDDLNRFLTRFGLTGYAPRIRVAYTITGSYDTTAGDGDPRTAERAVVENLCPDLRRVAPVVDGTDHHVVTVTAVPAPGTRPAPPHAAGKPTQDAAAAATKAIPPAKENPDDQQPPRP